MLDLMLGVESLEKVFTLGIESLPTNFWISWACVIWVSAAFHVDTTTFSLLVPCAFCVLAARRCILDIYLKLIESQFALSEAWLLVMRGYEG